MGLAYKENVPDTRESPVREIVKELWVFRVEIYGYDPLLSIEEIEGFGVKSLGNLGNQDVKVDCVIVAVAHDEFKNKPFLKKKAVTERNISSFSQGFLFREKVVNGKPILILINVRGIFNNQEAKRKGFLYKTL